MKMKNAHFLLIVFSIFFSCRRTDYGENKTVKLEIKPQVLMSNARVSDDSISTLRIRYDEYTGSLDFVVDSGTVYMTNNIYSSLCRTLQIDSLVSVPVNTKDMYFSDRNDFEMLWPSEGRYMSGSKYDGGWKKFLVTGKIAGFNYTKRSYGGNIAMVFDLQDFHEIPGTGDNPIK